MTNDAIKEIKKAEENGSQLIVNAKAEAKYRLEQTSLEIEKSKLDAEKNFKVVFDDRISAANAQAQEIVTSRITDATNEADGLESKARAKLGEAVNLIIEEIKALWQ